MSVEQPGVMHFGRGKSVCAVVRMTCGGPVPGLMQLPDWADREDLGVLSALSGLHTLCLTGVHWLNLHSEARALSVFDVSGSPLSNAA